MPIREHTRATGSDKTSSKVSDVVTRPSGRRRDPRLSVTYHEPTCRAAGARPPTVNNTAIPTSPCPFYRTGRHFPPHRTCQGTCVSGTSLSRSCRSAAYLSAQAPLCTSVLRICIAQVVARNDGGQEGVEFRQHDV